jgi:hypothetical protein
MVIESNIGRRAILVLGMHRSGTSATAGVLYALGVAGPKTLIPNDRFNPRGYWESKPLTNLNDQLITSADSGWDDWRSLDPKWFQSETAVAYREKIKAVLTDQFGNEPLFFIKDPRICRFIPFMTSILAEMNIQPVAILPLRNPLEVAHSLKKRDGMTLSKSLLLWLRYVLEAEYHSRNMPRCFLRYEAFLDDWRHLTQRAAQECGLTWPDQPDRSAAAISQFLAADLRHERVTSGAVKDNPEVAPLVYATYDALTAIAAGDETKEVSEQLDFLRKIFNESCQLFHQVIKVDELEITRLRSAFQENSDEMNSLRQERFHLVASSEKLSQEVRGSREQLHELSTAHGRILEELDNLAVSYRILAAERERIMRSCEELSAQRNAMIASRSWRMTAPMRRLRSMFLQYKSH